MGREEGLGFGLGYLCRADLLTFETLSSETLISRRVRSSKKHLPGSPLLRRLQNQGKLSLWEKVEVRHQAEAVVVQVVVEVVCRMKMPFKPGWMLLDEVKTE